MYKTSMKKGSFKESNSKFSNPNTTKELTPNEPFGYTHTGETLAILWTPDAGNALSFVLCSRQKKEPWKGGGTN